jgi:fatty acid desaturase
LAKQGLIPFYIVFLVNIVLTSKIAVLTHELVHEPESYTRWNWLLRLNIHMTSPFIFGFDEYKKMHLLHHGSTNTEQDPDYFMVKGGRIRSFVSLAFANEYWFFYALLHRQTQPGFLFLQIARLAIFFTYVYVLGFSNYLFLFFLPSKLSYGLSFYIFSHESHTNTVGLREGSYNLIPRFSFVHKLLKLVIGVYGYNIAYFHNTHHTYPWISGKKLHTVTATLQNQENILPSRQFIV